MNKRVNQLSGWLSATMVSGQPIRISGGLRGAFESSSSVVPLFEVSGPLMLSARLIVPDEPTAADTPGQDAFSSVKIKQVLGPEPGLREFWWAGWTKIFTACTFIAPRADAVRLADLLQDTRQLRLFCDTNALASGVAEWFLNVLPSGTQLISSAIADKEIMGWVDQNKKIYDGASAAAWEARTRFQLARRLTEYPPPHTVIDRLSPDQNALMLAQGTVEGAKSSQGDLLFVELARPLVRSQPRQARVVFLTGDANVARAATSALGPEHVLYANPDKEAAQAARGRVLARGFWHPTGPLGSVSLPRSDRLLWNLLAAFTFLVLEQGARRWVIEPVFSVRFGGPSDWADPWVRILAIEPPNDSGERSNSAPPNRSAAHHGAPAGATPSELQPGAPLETATLNEERLSSLWLLPRKEPMASGSELSASPRPARHVFFNLVSLGCFGDGVPSQEGDVQKETFRVLVGLGVIDDEGRPGPCVEEYRNAWARNDRDWFHAQLLHNHPGYRQVADGIRKGRFGELTSRESQFLPLMRALGQAARFPTSTAPPRIGDAPVNALQLNQALAKWLPQKDAAIKIGEASERAMEDLSLTPCRFELAMSRLWEEFREHPVEGRTGGEPDRTSTESIVELRPDGTFTFREVSPSVLMFGGSVPILFLARRR